MALTKVHNRMIAASSVNVTDFGAVGDGVTNDTAAFTAAMNAIASETEPKRLIAKGRFLIDLETIWNVTDDTVLDWSEAVFIPSSTDVTKTHIRIHGRPNGSMAKTYAFPVPSKTTVLTADALAGAVSIAVADASGIEENDLIVLDSAEEFQKNTANGRRTEEPARVSSVVGNTIYIDAPLLCDFTQAGNISGGGSGYPSVKVYKPADSVEIIGGTFEAFEQVSRSLYVTQMNLLVCKGQRFIDPLRRGMEVAFCSGDTHYDQVLERHGENAATDASPTTDFGYGVMHTYCCYSRVFGGQGRRGWHSYDATQAQRDITYSGFIGQMEEQSISSHADCILFRVVDCQFESKYSIHARARYNQIQNCRIRGVNSGAGIEWGADSYELHVSDCIFDGSWGNNYPINATTALRPTNATVKANSKIFIRNNVFSGVGGNIGMNRGATEIVFADNVIDCDDFNTTVSKVLGHLFANGLGYYVGNTFKNIMGGGRAQLSCSGESGATWTVSDNRAVGVAAHGSAGDFITTSGDDGMVFVVTNNTVNVDDLRYFMSMATALTAELVSGNYIAAGNVGAIFLRQTNSKTTTVERLSHNMFSSATAFKTQAFSGNTINITKDLFNGFSDT